MEAENGQVAVGWLRVSHRELDPEKSTPYQPWMKHEKLLKLKEGEIVPVVNMIHTCLYRKFRIKSKVKIISGVLPKIETQ